MKFVGRNEPCPCNSGRKYKHCCYARDRARANQRRDEVAAVRDALQQAVQFQQAGRLSEAEARYQRALQLNPELSPEDLAGVHYNLGNVQMEQGRPEDAVASYRRALEIQPHVVEISGNLGGALNDLGRLEEAAAIYRGALAVRPGDALLHFNLGNVLSEQGDVSAAVGCYQKAIALKPDFEDAHADLAAALNSLGRLEDEAASIRARIALKPDNADLHLTLGHSLMEQGKDSEAFASFRQAASLKPDGADAYSNTLWLAGYRASLEPAQYLESARGWEQAVVPASEREAARQRRFRRPLLAGRRLRVGYVSGDFRQHAVSYFIEHILKHHDRRQFEIFAYYSNKFRDEITARIEGLVDHWLPVAGLSDAVLRERIEADGIDVLVDLSGHTGFHRLGMFARRAAPVQAHYLGYHASTGLTEMDYWIGDGILVPPAHDAHFSEKLWRLPRTWVSYEGKAAAPAPGMRPAGDATVCLGSFNDIKKLTPATFSLWSRVLLALPEGRLLLKTRSLADAGNRKRVFDAFAAHGVAADRIELVDGHATPGWAEHMAYYGRIDIALDPAGAVGGGTTTCDALWMGVPLMTLAGDRMVSRMTASMLEALGHPEWVAASEAGYIATVVALARDVDLRRRLRLAQRDKMAGSPLCDARDLARRLEEAYVAMFER
jgi:predicted O-linked N-acetylglucosamine transferase (SPINDLY family)